MAIFDDFHEITPRSAYRLELDGPSMRKIKAAETIEPAAKIAVDDKTKGAKK